MGNKSSYFSSKSFGKPSKKVVFFFTALGTKYWLYYPTIKIYTKAGFHVVVYDTSPRIIFDENIFKFLDTGLTVANEVHKQITSLKKQGATSFYTHGTSMGTLYAMRSAIDNPSITKVIINLTYGRLSDNIWSWTILRRIRNRFIAAGITKEQVDQILDPISPITMAPKLKNKKVLLYLSKRDRVMFFEQTSQFREALITAGVDFKYYQNNLLGHNLSFITNNLRSKLYLQFLNDKG